VDHVEGPARRNGTAELIRICVPVLPQGLDERLGLSRNDRRDEIYIKPKFFELAEESLGKSMA
jgi:hypothetical protein